MASVVIVSDTCHYLPAELVAEHDIEQVSLYVHWKGETQRESEIADYDAYYERLGSAEELPTTSQPSIGDFLPVYEPMLERGDDIVSITSRAASPGRSSRPSRHASSSATRQGGERVHVIDSASACGGQGLLVLAAAAAAREGADAASGGGSRPRGAREPEDVVRDRHARVPAPRRADRRRPARGSDRR